MLGRSVLLQYVVAGLLHGLGMSSLHPSASKAGFAFAKVENGAPYRPVVQFQGWFNLNQLNRTVPSVQYCAVRCFAHARTHLQYLYCTALRRVSLLKSGFSLVINTLHLYLQQR